MFYEVTCKSKGILYTYRQHIQNSHNFVVHKNANPLCFEAKELLSMYTKQERKVFICCLIITAQSL